MLDRLDRLFVHGCAYAYTLSPISRLNPGVPPVLENCQVVNQAQSWFFLECDSIREVDDKSKEFYVLELYNADNGKLLANLTSDEPAFQVREWMICWTVDFIWESLVIKRLFNPENSAKT